MTQTNLSTEVRKPNQDISIIDIQGDVTGFAERSYPNIYQYLICS